MDPSSSNNEQPLLCVFVVEFDNTIGPNILLQSPAGFFGEGVFDTVADFIITRPDLCGKIINLELMQYRILSYCVRLEDAKYHRNALMFSVGFVFAKDFDSFPYQPVLAKLASTLEAMEEESEVSEDCAAAAHSDTYIQQRALQRAVLTTLLCIVAAHARMFTRIILQRAQLCSLCSAATTTSGLARLRASVP
jgi:hypothetical protein